MAGRSIFQRPFQLRPLNIATQISSGMNSVSGEPIVHSQIHIHAIKYSYTPSTEYRSKYLLRPVGYSWEPLAP